MEEGPPGAGEVRPVRRAPGRRGAPGRGLARRRGTVTFEDWERERVRRAVGVVATLDADGSPRAVPVLVSIEGDGLRFETDPGSRKYRNLSRDPRVAVVVQGPPKWGVSVQGRAEVLSDGATGGQAQIRVVPATKASWRRREG
ncbi:MAG: pyridoxamine 5'-phosphate oxidase family protein [Actinomycetota bacterium]